MINLIVKKIIKYLKIEQYNYLVKLCTINIKRTNKNLCLTESIGHEAEVSLFIERRLYVSFTEYSQTSTVLLVTVS